MVASWRRWEGEDALLGDSRAPTPTGCIGALHSPSGATTHAPGAGELRGTSANSR